MGYIGIVRYKALEEAAIKKAFDRDKKC